MPTVTIYKAIKTDTDVNNNPITTVVEFFSESERDAYANANDCDTLSEQREISSPTPQIPDVTPRQIRQALVLSGVTMQDIESALDSLSEPTKTLAKIEWEYSIAFQRNRPLVAEVATALGWTSQQVDDLWILAATL